LIPNEARDILLYYGGVVAAGLLIFLLAMSKKRKGMRLRLKGTSPKRGPDNLVHLDGRKPPDKYSHIQPAGERPLNVVFNYNGHSWDAYEVLGLPAGSSLESVERAYREALKSVDPGSSGFIEAAFHAIRSEWKSYRVAGSN